ncbi:Crp/Fnr family transcriptional regulator [Virgibacillus indicus]|uniref:Crp/Fnr family transcriptional regulator n=1 Tax=Virgibacillus indicus TaxID=2024554 RepID=A0A265NAP9_9BACI|nr:Crp/Fnr family transcriptional regulator [Virgibacillus indicus]OZU89098.1 Crp/Fnr family transcriptional regulator [Virgibacillus indicus]
MHTHDNTYDHHTIGTYKPCVSLVPIFNHLDAMQLDEIIETTKSTSYKKGEIIYHAGDQSDSLYIVNKGKIKIYRLAESGKEQLVRILSPGEFTGEYALFNESIHESYAEALMDTSVCMIKRSDLQEILMKFQSISLKILAAFSKRIDQSERQTTLFATEKVETRIALFLAQCLGNDQSNEIILPMSKKDIASYLGTTPETISRKLTQLEEKRYIKQKSNKKIEIVDLDGLLLV